jgi:hypothetical protein
MKFIIVLLLSVNIAFASSVSGVVKVKGKVPTGTLYIFAKKYNGKMPMPLAVIKVESPTYPYKFVLDESKQMMKGMPFKGPFKIVARVSPSGSAMDKSGIEVSTKKAIELGDSKVELILGSSE